MTLSRDPDASCSVVPCRLKGLVVSLSEAGTLMVSYMGTSPPLSVVGGLEGKVRIHSPLCCSSMSPQA